MKSGIFVSSGVSRGYTVHPIGDLAMIEQLFDHVPETVFFVKDHQGKYLAVNETMVRRCGIGEKSEIIGKDVRDIFPKELAERYARQDETVLRSGRPILDRLELHWYDHREAGWCLTTKLPWRDQNGKIAGIVGISRDIRAPGDRDTIPTSLLATLDYLESHCSETISPSSLSRHSGIPPVRFARLIKRIFRMTPHQLITQTRLASASYLLVETVHSVADIAFECGFYDHSAFTRAFHSVTGLTPTQFRGVRKKVI